MTNAEVSQNKNPFPIEGETQQPGVAEAIKELAPLPEVPETVKKGWVTYIDGKQAEVSQIVFHNARLGASASYGHNGAYDTLRINELGGPVTIPYVYHPAIGMLIGLVQEERPNMGGKVWNVPRGMVDPGEGLADASHRELEEETGHTVNPHEEEKHLHQLSQGGNPNSAYFNTDPQNPDQGFSVFALRFDPKDLVPMQDENGVIDSYSLTTSQKVNGSGHEKVYDMRFVNVARALQQPRDGQTAEEYTRDGYTAAAVGHLMTEVFAEQIQGESYAVKQARAAEAQRTTGWSRAVR